MSSPGYITSTLHPLGPAGPGSEYYAGLWSHPRHEEFISLQRSVFLHQHQLFMRKNDLPWFPFTISVYIIRPHCHMYTIHSKANYGKNPVASHWVLMKGIWRRATLPPGHPGSTIAAGGLNCWVRDVSRCCPSAIVTRKLLGFTPPKLHKGKA